MKIINKFRNTFIYIILILLNCINKSNKEKNRNILLVSDFAKFGGVRTYFFQLIHFYKSKNYLISCIIFRSSLDDDLKKYFKINNIKVHTIQNIKYKNFCSLIKEIRIVNSLIHEIKPELCLVSVGAVGLFFYFFALTSKLLYVIHTMPQLKVNTLYYKIINKYINNFKRIITVSSTSTQSIKQYILKEKKHSYVDTVYNFIDSVDPKIIKKYRMRNNKIIVLTLGHVVEYKNPFFWIEIAAKLISLNHNKNIKFIWAGDGDQLTACKNYITYKKYSKNIKFVGYQKDIHSLYKDCDIYFQPSLSESHGISVVQAMTYGIPCVVSNIGGLPESVENNLNGFIFDVNNIDQAAECINKLINNSKLRRAMGNAGRKRFNQMFTKEIWENKMNEINRILDV